MGLVVALFYWKPVLSFVTLDVGQGFMAGVSQRNLLISAGNANLLWAIHASSDLLLSESKD